jgi:MYXO-CTERM domain-containing protein
MYQGGDQIGSTYTYMDGNPTINYVGFVSTGDAVRNVSAFQLTAVPEPTAALLGTLGMLALLRRRRA